MTFLIESIIACAVFTLFVFLMSRNPIKTIFNYPPAIIERCDKLGLVDAGNKPGGAAFYARLDSDLSKQIYVIWRIPVLHFCRIIIIFV